MHGLYQNGYWNGFEVLTANHIFFFGLLPLLIWLLVWKGWALWLAARRGEMVWFIVLLAINTLGLLEIFYIFVIAKQKDSRVASPEMKEEPKTIGEMPVKSKEE